MASNLKKALGIMNKKKSDQNSDEEACAYTDPAVLHATDPPSRNHRGLSHPHYPPPRPQHSPNPRRKNHEQATQGNKRTQTNDNVRPSSSAFNSGEPRRAPPRPCLGKKSEEDDYCDPIDVQRKDDFFSEKTNRPKDDYCEPWDSTTKSDFGKKLAKKKSQSDDEHNEYMDPYGTGRDGVIEKRMSKGLGKEFAVLQQKKHVDADSKTYDQVFEPSRKSGALDDYDTPWEWKKQAQLGKVKIQAPKPAAQNQRAKPGNAPSDDYDEPWEKKQGYFKTQLTPGGKPRSPVPLPRTSAPPTDNEGQIYDRPWDPSQANDQSNVKQPQAGGVYETPWEENSSNEMNGRQKSRETSPRRSSQPAVLPSSVQPTQNRKFSQPAVPASANYDTPWEYKMPKQFAGTAPPKPSRLNEYECQECEVNPDLPLDDQGWYHGPLKRLEAEDLLRDAQDCSFLVRNSESSKKDFSLSMKNNENFLHLRIVRQLDGQYILGQFSKPFMDIPKVIHHYSRNKLNIRGAEHKFLKHPINIQPEYHTIEPEDDSHL